jgi:hypothetical protein
MIGVEVMSEICWMYTYREWRPGFGLNLYSIPSLWHKNTIIHCLSDLYMVNKQAINLIKE